MTQPISFRCFWICTHWKHQRTIDSLMFLFFWGGGGGWGDMEREIYNCIADGTTFVKPSVTIKFPSSLTKLSWEWGLTAVVHLKSCFPCHSSSLQIIVETSRVVFQISSSIHCLIPIRLGCLVSYISM